MDQIVTEFLIQGIAIPIGVAIVATGILRFALGRKIGIFAAGAAIGIAFLTGYFLNLGWPRFPPPASSQKIFYLALFGTGIGLIFDLAGSPKFLRIFSAIAWPVAVIGWIGWRQVNDLSFENSLTLAVLLVAGIYMLSLLAADRDMKSSAPVSLLVAAIGLSMIALFGSSGLLSQLAAVTAAAAGGFLLWNWPIDRYPFGAAAIMGGGGALLSVAIVLTLFTGASKWAMAILLLCFLAPGFAGRIRMGRGSVIGAIVIGIVALVPAAAAVLVAFLVSRAQV